MARKRIITLLFRKFFLVSVFQISDFLSIRRWMLSLSSIFHSQVHITMPEARTFSQFSNKFGSFVLLFLQNLVGIQTTSKILCNFEKNSQKASKTARTVLLTQDVAFFINENNLNLYKVICYVNHFDPSLSQTSLGYVCYPQKIEYSIITGQNMAIAKSGNS